MAQKLGNGGTGPEEYDESTGRYIKQNQLKKFIEKLNSGKIGFLSDNTFGDIPSWVVQNSNNNQQSPSFVNNAQHNKKTIWQRIKEEAEALKKFDKIDGEHDFSSDLLAVNKANFKVSSQASNKVDKDKYTSNCTHCAISYEIRRRGYNVEATEYLKGDMLARGGYRNHTLVGITYDHTINRDPNVGWSGLNATRKANARAEAEQSMLKQGEGARFFVRLQWTGANCGHAFCAEVVNGKVMWLDPQDGHNLTDYNGKSEIDNYIHNCVLNSFCFVRCDNKIIKQKALNIAARRK